MAYHHNLARQTRFTWAARSFVGHSSTTDGTAIGSDTPAVSSVTMALNLSETTRTMCSLSDTCLLSHSICGMWVQKLIQQTVSTKPRTINHNGPISVLHMIFQHKAYFKLSVVDPSESNGKENYWTMWLFTPCLRWLRCRCYKNLTRKFLKGHINCSWNKQPWVFSHIENILFHPLKEQDRVLLPALFISQAVRKETLGIPLKNQLHYIF